MIAKDGSGRLFLYPGNGASGFGRASQIGTGWGDFKYLVGAGDMDSDAVYAADLLGVLRGWKNLSPMTSAGVYGPATYTCPTNSDLRLYFGNGTGGFGRSEAGYLSEVVGSAWCKFSAVIAGGDRVLIARDTSGNLWRYARSGTSSWAPAQRIGTGWGSLRLIG